MVRGPSVLPRLVHPDEVSSRRSAVAALAGVRISRQAVYDGGATAPAPFPRDATRNVGAPHAAPIETGPIRNMAISARERED
jgi:hypothetical protein